MLYQNRSFQQEYGFINIYKTGKLACHVNTDPVTEKFRLMLPATFQSVSWVPTLRSRAIRADLAAQN
jgi:hypothetical protein